MALMATAKLVVMVLMVLMVLMVVFTCTSLNPTTKEPTQLHTCVGKRRREAVGRVKGVAG